MNRFSFLLLSWAASYPLERLNAWPLGLAVHRYMHALTRAYILQQTTMLLLLIVLFNTFLLLLLLCTPNSYIYGLAMVGCVWLALYGYQILHIWVFLGGFVSAGFFIYTVSTVVFNGEICCGNGDEAETERARVMASLGIGVVAGALAIYALKVGVFLSGTCFGLGLALSTRTVLAHLHVFQTGTSFATFYLISALVGGLLAVYKERPIIVLATSFGGCFGFFICVGYFQDCPFIDTITHVEEAVETHSKSPDNLPECAKVEGILFVATFVLSALFQYGCLCCSSEDDRRCGGCFGCFGGSNGGGGGGSGAFGDFEWATIDDTFGYADEVDYYDAESSTGVGRSRRRQQEKEFRGGEGPSVSRSSRSSRSSNRASFSPAVLRHGVAARPKRNRSGPPPPTGGRDKSVRGGGGGGGSSSVGRFGSSKGTSRSKQLSVNGRKGYARVPATEAWSSSSDDDGNHSSESPLRTRSHTRRSRKYRTTSFQ